MTRKSLSDILHGADRDRLQDAWNSTQAADDYGTPLPPGEYVCHLIAADFFNATKGTPGVKLAFKVIEGEHIGRRVWYDCWLTGAALPQTKRDLTKLGIDRLDQVEQPLPQGIRCTVRVVLRTDDDGSTHNRVKTFAVIGIDEPPIDPFAPVDPPESAPAEAAEGEHYEF